MSSQLNHHSSSLTFNHENAIRNEPHPLYRAEVVLDGVSHCQNDNYFLAVLYIYIGLMPFLAATPDMCTIYVHHVEVADEDPASRSLCENLPNGDSRASTARCRSMSMPRTVFAF